MTAIVERAPSLDFLSFQIYGEIDHLPEILERVGYDGPYQISRSSSPRLAGLQRRTDAGFHQRTWVSYFKRLICGSYSTGPRKKRYWFISSKRSTKTGKDQTIRWNRRNTGVFIERIALANPHCRSSCKTRSRLAVSVSCLTWFSSISWIGCHS